MDIFVNDCYVPFLDEDSRTQIFYGGSSSGKSYFLAQRTIMDVVRGRNYLIARNVARTVRHSVYNQIVKTISEFGLEREFTINKSEMVITCDRNGKQILFAGLDDVEKLKSVTPADGVLTDIWIEEATEIGYEAYKQLTKRLRGKSDMDRNKRIMFSFNPIVKAHWIYKEFFGTWDDGKRFHRGEDVVILKSTYKDNKFLASDDIKALETEKDKYFYEVYTLGNWGTLGKAIFKNWRVEDLSDKSATFDNIYNGLDFGFSEDPTAMIRVHHDRTRKKIYVLDELYKGGMHVDEMAEALRGLIGNGHVTCDSAEPRSISELNRAGIRAIGARKGADSVAHGIQWLQQHEIIIDARCQNFKNEIQVYQWREDKYGNATRRPVDKDNHLLDALRYALESVMLESTASAGRRI